MTSAETDLAGPPRWLVGGAIAALACGLALAVWLGTTGAPPVQYLDNLIRVYLGSTEPVGGALVWFLESFGYWLGYLLLGITLVGLAVARRWSMVLVVGLSAALGPGLLSQGLKRLVDRPRPASDPAAGLFGPWVGVDHGSYPSGHSMAMGLAVGLVWIILPVAWRRWWAPLGLALAAAMAWQRITVNAHWFSDTLAGLTMGAAVVVLVWWLVSRLGERRRTDAEA